MKLARLFISSRQQRALHLKRLVLWDRSNLLRAKSSKSCSPFVGCVTCSTRDESLTQQRPDIRQLRWYCDGPVTAESHAAQGLRGPNIRPSSRALLSRSISASCLAS